MTPEQFAEIRRNIELTRNRFRWEEYMHSLFGPLFKEYLDWHQQYRAVTLHLSKSVGAEKGELH